MPGGSHDRCPLGGGLDIDCYCGALYTACIESFSFLLWLRTKEMGSISSSENLLTAIHSIVTKFLFLFWPLTESEKKGQLS